MKFIEAQDIGVLNNTPQATADGEKENEREEINDNLLPMIPCHFIDLKERLLQMADLYLNIESYKPNFLTWFGKAKGHILVALGANEACAWLVSFLNVLEKVASPDDNFIICGANSKEDHPSMLEYGRLLKSQIAERSLPCGKATFDQNSLLRKLIQPLELKI